MIEITLLGTTAGMPTKKRAHPAIALKYEGKILLFDCGENTQRHLMLAKISPMKISSIFITHWHADHFAGLPGLIQTLSLKQRTEPLDIFGPKETIKFFKQLIGVGYFAKTFKINVHEIKKAGIVLKTKKYSVSALPVKHSIPTLAFKFEEAEKPGHFDVKKAKKLGLQPYEFGILQKGSSVKIGNKIVKPSDVMGHVRKGLSVVYSGDTAKNPKLITFSKGTDLLIHEATFAEDLKDNAYKVGHATAKQAAEIAKKACVKKLILTHISGRYKEPEVLLEEARKVFKSTELAEDFLKIELKK